MPWVGLQYVNVVFPDHFHLLFYLRTVDHFNLILYIFVGILKVLNFEFLEFGILKILSFHPCIYHA